MLKATNRLANRSTKRIHSSPAFMANWVTTSCGVQTPRCLTQIIVYAGGLYVLSLCVIQYQVSQQQHVSERTRDTLWYTRGSEPVDDDGYFAGRWVQTYLDVIKNRTVLHTQRLPLKRTTPSTPEADPTEVNREPVVRRRGRGPHAIEGSSTTMSPDATTDWNLDTVTPDDGRFQNTGPPRSRSGSIHRKQGNFDVTSQPEEGVHPKPHTKFNTIHEGVRRGQSVFNRTHPSANSHPAMSGRHPGANKLHPIRNTSHAVAHAEHAGFNASHPESHKPHPGLHGNRTGSARAHPGFNGTRPGHHNQPEGTPQDPERPDHRPHGRINSSLPGNHGNSAHRSPTSHSGHSAGHSVGQPREGHNGPQPSQNRHNSPTRNVSYSNPPNHTATHDKPNAHHSHITHNVTHAHKRDPEAVVEDEMSAAHATGLGFGPLTPSPDRIVYNSLGGCAGNTLVSLFRGLANRNNFDFRSSDQDKEGQLHSSEQVYDL